MSPLHLAQIDPLTESDREDPDTSFDWFKSYADLATHIRLFIPDKTARILMLGCGNSKFSEDVGKHAVARLRR